MVVRPVLDTGEMAEWNSVVLGTYATRLLIADPDSKLMWVEAEKCVLFATHYSADENSLRESNAMTRGFKEARESQK